MTAAETTPCRCGQPVHIERYAPRATYTTNPDGTPHTCPDADRQATMTENLRDLAEAAKDGEQPHYWDEDWVDGWVGVQTVAKPAAAYIAAASPDVPAALDLGGAA